MFFGETRPYGALLSYWVGAEADGGTARIEVRDASGVLVSVVSGPAEPGLNRFAWNLRMEGDSAEAASAKGLEVLPGRYSVRVAVGEVWGEGELEVLADPRETRPLEERYERLAARRSVQGWVGVGTRARERLSEAAEALEQILERLDDEAGQASLREDGESLQAVLQSLTEELFSGPSCQGICGGRTPMSLVRGAARTLGSSVAAPGENDRTAMRLAEGAAGEIVEAVNRVFTDEVTPYRRALLDAGFTPLPEYPQLELPAPKDGDQRP